MCGISALFSVSNNPLNTNEIVLMNRMIEHRGPDDTGYAYFDKSLNRITEFESGENCKVDFALNTFFSALAHRRLSIIDLTETGHQPMSYANGRLWITYNGEIYNYIELRESLINKGYTFTTSSDTEVILAAYEHWGKDCLEHFEGMFAFVLVDRMTKHIFTARDRFGIKPLYYWFSQQGMLAFASEIKQFTVLPGWQPVLNMQRGYEFLCFGMLDHTSETLFEGVYQMRGGEAFYEPIEDLTKHCYGKGKLPVYRWYELKARPFEGSFKQAAAGYRELFFETVSQHLRSDVAVGSCLSGGLDSSSIVCTVNELLGSSSSNGGQKTFSAYSKIAALDESYYIEKVVDETGAESHSIYPSVESLFDNLDKLVWLQDEPFGSTSVYAQWSVFSLASRERVKVMLDGQGGDEQLLGYHGFMRTYLAELLRSARFFDLARELNLLRTVHGYKAVERARMIISAGIPYSLRRGLRTIMKNEMLKPAWLNVDYGIINAHYPVDNYAISSVEEDSKSQILDKVLPRLLHWEDRNSMAFSIESRVPFIDHRLMEYALGLPTEYKINKSITKLVLREAMKGILPEAVRLRTDKIGFETPEEHWLKSEAPAKFIGELKKAPEITDGLLTVDAVSLADNLISGREVFSNLPWRLISFTKWYERYSLKH